MELNVNKVISHFICRVNFYVLNLSAFNEIFGFSPSLDVTMRKVLGQFKPNAF